MDRRGFLTTAGASLLSATSLGVMPAFASVSPSAGFPERLLPTRVQVRPEFAAGTIHVIPQAHYLYWIEEPGMAVRYGVGVGRAGLEFQGAAKVQRKAVWPDWRPTDEMIEREPEVYEQFADGVPGGPGNPLGARALYLYENGIDTYYRIHGTTQPNSIGRSVSNGCIRMLNDHVRDLYDRVPLGTTVIVY